MVLCTEGEGACLPLLVLSGNVQGEGGTLGIRIEKVESGSEAEALGLQPGDELLSVDENQLNDTLDYDFYTDSKSFHLRAKVADGIRE